MQQPETAQQKKERLGKELLALKDKWPYQERIQWAIANDYNERTIVKNFLSGFITTIPTAEKLKAEIEEYLKQQ
jgi:hypothetical protein